jgi:release factor H-coupled RctB family protein
VVAAAEAPDPEADAASVPDVPELGLALGSIGGGNHFLELGEVTAVSDKAAARALGLERGGFAVLAHSGSRGLGAWLLDQWGDRVLEGAEIDRYLGQLRGAVRFARANRLVLAWRLLRAVGCNKPGRSAGAFDLVHNDVTAFPTADGPTWLHRKGAAPAERDQPTVVLGSRGAASHVLLGAGAEGCLCTVAHGAGRRMGRSEAIAKLKTRYHRAELLRTPQGGRVICPDNDLLYAEHPDAYKPMDPVIAALELAGAARRVVALSPRITIKR